MKRIALVAFSALLIVSCSPVKSLYRSTQQAKDNTEQQLTKKKEVAIDSTADTSVRDATATTSTTESTAERATDEEVITSVREYDTSLPTDAATGTPPLKKETTQTRRKASTEKQQQQTEQTTERTQELAGKVRKQQTETTDLQAARQTQSDTETQVDSEQKRGLTSFQWVLCSLGAIVLLGAAAWLGWKLFKRHL